MLKLYDFECTQCSRTAEALVHTGEIPPCPECGGETVRLPPVFRVNTGPVPVHGYYDENLETYITSNAHRKQVMREQGVTEHGATPKLEEQAWV